MLHPDVRLVDILLSTTRVSLVQNKFVFCQRRVHYRCILSPFLFCLAIDWIMKRTDIGVKSGIIWTFTESLGDLDFADDIALLAHSHRVIQSKTEKLVRNASKVGLHVNKDKTKTMRNNCQTADPVKLGEQYIEDVTEFTYPWEPK